jgi:anti-anti-sigma regulatory factor
LAAPDESPSPSPSLPAGPTFPAIEIGASGRIDRTEIAELCERVRVLLGDDAVDQIVCDVGAVMAPDAVTIDALARLQLTAKRMGCEMRIRRASPELRDLIAFMGLSGVVPLSDQSAVEARRQPKEGEQRVRGEEEGDPADPAVR